MMATLRFPSTAPVLGQLLRKAGVTALSNPATPPDHFLSLADALEELRDMTPVASRVGITDWIHLERLTHLLRQVAVTTPECTP